MDYGKLAYLKAEELESRLSAPGRKLPAAAGFAPRTQLTGETELTALRASGAVAIVLKLTLSAAGPVSGRLSAAVNGLVFAETDVAFTGEYTELLIGAAEFSGEAMLSLFPENLSVAVLVRAEVLTVGGDGIGREASDFAVAQNETAVLAAVGRNMSVIGRILSADGTLGAETVLGRGSRFDVCGAADGFILAHNDATGNLWLKKLNNALETTAVLHAGGSVASPAVCVCDGRVWLAYARDGEIRLRTADAGLTKLSASVSAGFGRADGVRFVRGAPRPVAVVSEDGRCRLKFSEPETVLGATLAVTAGFTAEGKDD